MITENVYEKGAAALTAAGVDLNAHDDDSFNGALNVAGAIIQHATRSQNWTQWLSNHCDDYSDMCLYVGGALLNKQTPPEYDAAN